MPADKTIPRAAELRWRIPTTGDPIQLRLALAQVALATVVAALVVLVATPAEWRGPALVGLIPLAVFVAYRRWAKYHQALAGPDNVRLDETGLHWRAADGSDQSFARDSVVAFRVAREDDTLRPVPALTLYLAGGFESQPIELHPPAMADVVRSLLVDGWQLAEQSPVTSQTAGALHKSQGEGGYDLAIDVYSECHDEFQEWHLEGTRAALAELADAFAETARLPLPPAGAKPLGRVLLLRRREQTRLRAGHDRHSRMGHDSIILPADKLLELSRLIANRLQELAAAPSRVPAAIPADLKFDFPLGRGNVWTFHLHIREP